jgi:broad specificity phosphatase PhoE
MLKTGAVIAAVVFSTAPPAGAQQAVIAVRHAEKVDESKDPPLSPAGRKRALALARHLRTAGVDAIYVTQYQRTALTAAPLAAIMGLKPIVVRADVRQQLVDRIRRENADDVVLVVGHSDTVPDILRLLGHRDPVTIPSAEHDNLFVAVPREGGPPAVLRLRY